MAREGRGSANGVCMLPPRVNLSLSEGHSSSDSLRSFFDCALQSYEAAGLACPSGMSRELFEARVDSELSSWSSDQVQSSSHWMPCLMVPDCLPLTPIACFAAVPVPPGLPSLLLFVSCPWHTTTFPTHECMDPDVMLSPRSAHRSTLPASCCRSPRPFLCWHIWSTVSSPVQDVGPHRQIRHGVLQLMWHKHLSSEEVPWEAFWTCLSKAISSEPASPVKSFSRSIPWAPRLVGNVLLLVQCC